MGNIGVLNSGNFDVKIVQSGVWTIISNIDLSPGIYIVSTFVRIRPNGVNADVQKLCGIGVRTVGSSAYNSIYDSRPSTPGNYLSVTGIFNVTTESTLAMEVIQIFGVDATLDSFKFNVVKIWG